MHLIDFLVYHVRPYGLDETRPATPEPPPDVFLNATPWVLPPEETKKPNITIQLQEKVLKKVVKDSEEIAEKVQPEDAD